MLASVTSAELAELRAYELVHGEIGTQYSDEALAKIHEQLQQVCRILVAVNSKEGAKIPDVQEYPRPDVLFSHYMEQEAADDADE